jgi:hypothetical protein
MHSDFGSVPMAMPPLSSVRIPSISDAGSLLRFASVRFCDRLLVAEAFAQPHDVQHFQWGSPHPRTPS